MRNYRTRSEDPKDALAKLATKARELTTAALGDRPHYLLSELGVALGPDLQALKLLTGGGLVEFVQKYLSDRYELILTGKHGNVHALVKKGSVIGAVPAPDAEQETPRGPRFHYRFWAAFSVPLDGEQRYLDMIKFTFEDVPKSVPPPANSLAIDSELIAPVNIAQRDEVISGNIKKWLEANKLQPDDFFASAKRRRSGESVVPTGSLLDLLISALDRRQLQSISLSLDVVATLARKRSQP